MGKKIEPCPFCGSEARGEQYITEAAIFCIDPKCGAKIICTAKKWKDLEEATKRWNRRRA